MNVFLRSMLATAVGAVFVAGSMADRSAGGADDKGPPLQTNDPESTEQETGPIDPISRLVELRLTTTESTAPPAGAPAWKTVDALLDVEVGRVVMLLAQPAEGDQPDSGVWIPWSQIGSLLKQQPVSSLKQQTAEGIRLRISDADLKKLPRAGASDKLSRDWVAKVIGSIRPVGPASVTGRKYDPDTELVRWSKLLDKGVVNRAGQDLGKIAGLSIAVPSGRIAYAAMTSPDLPKDQLRPVPLSAFVAPPDKDQWLLELPENIVKHTATFARGAWPKALDQGWVEYVHVRYGRSLFEGVRLEPHGEKTGPK